jgi:hypothetical protein
MTFPKPNGEKPLKVFLYPSSQSESEMLVISHQPSVDVYIQGRDQSGVQSLIHVCAILEKFPAEPTPEKAKQVAIQVLDNFNHTETLLAVVEDCIKDVTP